MMLAHPAQQSQTVAGAMPQHLREQSDARTPPQSAGNGAAPAHRRAPWLLVVNKSDLASTEAWQTPNQIQGLFSAAVSTSAATGQGLGDLKSAVLELAGAPQLAGGAAHRHDLRCFFTSGTRCCHSSMSCTQAWSVLQLSKAFHKIKCLLSCVAADWPTAAACALQSVELPLRR